MLSKVISLLPPPSDPKMCNPFLFPFRRLGGDTLTKSRINNVDSLVTKIANLQLTSIVGDNTPIFALRGVSM